MSCKECETANDIDYRFCKMCGHPRDVLNCSDDFLEKKDQMVHTIDERIKTLDSLLDAGSYTKQKCNLKTELEIFLYTLDPLKNITNATPEDIRKFFVFKEKNGRTQLHNDNCEFRNEHNLQECYCPTN